MSGDQLSRLAAARALVEQLAVARPSEVSVAALGVKQKAPYKAQVIRGALIWRTEETGRSACDLLDRDDLVAGILLTRATLEGAAIVWRLKDLIENRSSISPGELDAKLMNMLMGSRTDVDFPAQNILGMLDRLDKKFPGMRRGYDTLSEFAHPNFNGVARSFSKIIQNELTTEFSQRSKELHDKERLAGNYLCVALMAFIAGYNKISDLMEPWLSELDPIWPPD